MIAFLVLFAICFLIVWSISKILLFILGGNKKPEPSIKENSKPTTIINNIDESKHVHYHNVTQHINVKIYKGGQEIDR